MSEQNPKFKKGDKVVCVDDEGAFGAGRPQKGKTYTVYSYDAGLSHVVLEECGKYGWLVSRFELVGDGLRDKLETKDTNPKDGAATSRLDMTLVPQSSIAYAALAFTEGALKYGAVNWRVAGVRASVYVAACLRHLFKWYNGEEVDPKTGVPHLANALACLAVLVDAYEIGKLHADRPPRQNLGDLLTRFEGKVRDLQQQLKNPPPRYREKP